MRNRRQVDRFHLEPDVAGHAARHVEDVVDQLRLRLGIAFDRLDRAPGLLLIQLSADQHPRPAEDGAERCAQLVRNGREEFVLQAVEIVGLAEQPRVLNRERHPPREILDQRDVGGRVVVMRFLLGPAERHHADGPAARAQRRADVGVGPEDPAQVHDIRFEVGDAHHHLLEAVVRDDQRFAAAHHFVGERGHVARRRRRNQPLRQLTQRRFLLADDVAPRHQMSDAMFVAHDHGAVVAEARQRDVHRAVEGGLVVERRGQQLADLREKLQPVARLDRFRRRLALAQQQLLLDVVNPQAIADVARDLRRADDLAGPARDRRLRDQDVHERAVFPPAPRLQRLDALAAADSRQDVLLLGQPLGRNDDRDRPADDFFRGITEQPLRRARSTKR